MTWLATTGFGDTLIGLFGTVWGIIDAIFRMGSAGAASLRASRRAFPEALVTPQRDYLPRFRRLFLQQFLGEHRDLGQRLDTFAMESGS